MAWTANNNPKVIETPRGPYTPTSDELKAEIVKAAKYAGFAGKFRVFLDGTEILDASNLPTDSIAALTVPIRLAQYDTAGC